MKKIRINISDRRFDPTLNKLNEKELEFEREAFLMAFIASEETLKVEDMKTIGCSVYVGTELHSCQKSIQTKGT